MPHINWKSLHFYIMHVYSIRYECIKIIIFRPFKIMVMITCKRVKRGYVSLPNRKTQIPRRTLVKPDIWHQKEKKQCLWTFELFIFRYCSCDMMIIIPREEAQTTTIMVIMKPPVTMRPAYANYYLKSMPTITNMMYVELGYKYNARSSTRLF